VAEGELVTLTCRAETLSALASGLTRYGPAGGGPDWLVSGVWLCTDEQQYLATASVEVLPNGFVTRSLSIVTPEELRRDVEAELPNVSGRLLVHGNGMELPSAGALSAPETLKPWPDGPYSTRVLVRVSQRADVPSRVACGLLFASNAGGSLVVAADVSTLAIVLSEEGELIERYCKDCEVLSPADYLALCER
jgi:hypothetical protein